MSTSPTDEEVRELLDDGGYLEEPLTDEWETKVSLVCRALLADRTRLDAELRELRAAVDGALEVIGEMRNHFESGGPRFDRTWSEAVRLIRAARQSTARTGGGK